MAGVATAKREAEAALRAAGTPAEAPWTTVKERSWASVWKTTTARGRVFLKLLPAAVRHEVGVTRIVSARWPEGTVPLLASDETAGWLLLGDGGTTVREADGEDDPAKLAVLLGEAHAWKERTAGELGALLAAGCPDRRLERLPDLASELLERFGERCGMELRRALDPRDVAECCDQLDALGLAARLHHDDIHLANAFPSGNATGPRYRLFDWGDAALSHPLFDVMDPSRHFERDPSTRAALLDAYLAPFGDVDGSARVVALKLARLVRAATWANLDELLSDAERARFGDPVVAMLAEYAAA